MADKETIIDGIDVSGCEHCVKMTKYRCIIQRDVYKCLCEENPNCYYKQLKRKEQECDKLYIQLKADEEYHKEEENTLRKIIKNKEERNIELYKENNQLKEDNEELKKQVCGLRPELKSIINKTCSKYNIETKAYHEKIIEIMNNLDKYKQALDEIEKYLAHNKNTLMVKTIITY